MTLASPENPFATGILILQGRKNSRGFERCKACLSPILLHFSQKPLEGRLDVLKVSFWIICEVELVNETSGSRKKSLQKNSKGFTQIINVFPVKNKTSQEKNKYDRAEKVTITKCQPVQISSKQDKNDSSKSRVVIWISQKMLKLLIIGI